MGGFKPYVGAGVQYIHFFDEGSNIGGKLDIDDAFGFALQAGVDVTLGDGWYLNADVKKIWIDTDVTWTNTGLGTLHADNVDIDPWIISAGVGYRFNLSDLLGGVRHLPSSKQKNEACSHFLRRPASGEGNRWGGCFAGLVRLLHKGQPRTGEAAFRFQAR